MGDERSRELTRRTDAAMAHSKALAHRVADLSDTCATTEDEIAELHDNLTGNEVDTYRRRRAAEEARVFAAHEREESKRWRAVADAAQGATATERDEPDPPRP